MQDNFGRTIDYLRISVTDRCNLRCTYCMPEDGVKLIPHDRILSYEEIVDFTRTAVDMGIRKVRLTGGEPLIRRNIISLVEMLASIKGIEDLAMTTNGTMLAEYAEGLRTAGLHRVNISLDTISPVRYRQTTRGGDIAMAFAGIEAAKATGLTPVKLNCVVRESFDEPDAKDVLDFARREGLEARFIRRMNIAAGEFHIVHGGNGGNCPECNRLRLSSDGRLRPCLFNDLQFDVRGIGAREAVRRAVRQKPESGTQSGSNRMHSIGG